ncbi:MAG: hypothetical protein IAG10_32545 [Planctomycetaceae bacterium]|nr:hypothetical protein [Planctomycetaceae bacterium]
MSHIVVSSNVREVLAALEKPTEIVDENGKLLGKFEPTKYDTEWPLGGITDEELQRRLAEEPTGRTWADIRRDLEAMEK